MSTQLIRPGEYRDQPWKNGRGSTREIAIEPAGARFPENFLWRLSSATVKEAGPFSTFPGYARWLAVWHGAGLLLNGARLEPLTPFAFSGVEPMQCTPLGQNVLDIGLIYREDLFKASLTVVSNGFKGQGADWDLLTGIVGRFRVNGVDCTEGETVRVEGREQLEISPAEAFSCFHFAVTML